MYLHQLPGITGGPRDQPCLFARLIPPFHPFIYAKSDLKCPNIIFPQLSLRGYLAVAPDSFWADK